MQEKYIPSNSDQKGINRKDLARLTEINTKSRKAG